MGFSGFKAVPVYRAYIVVANHFRRAEVLDCVSDDKALDLAREFLNDGEAVEIWERARFVARMHNPQPHVGSAA